MTARLTDQFLGCAQTYGINPQDALQAVERPEDVGHDFPHLYCQLREWGFTEASGFAGRRRFAYALANT